MSEKTLFKLGFRKRHLDFLKTQAEKDGFGSAFNQTYLFCMKMNMKGLKDLTPNQKKGLENVLRAMKYNLGELRPKILNYCHDVDAFGGMDLPNFGYQTEEDLYYMANSQYGYEREND